MYRKLFLILGSFVLIVAFNNCGDGFVTNAVNTGSRTFASTGSICEDELLDTYAKSYHPFLAKNCDSCHVSGPGIGTFASYDVVKSFTSFLNIGPARINAQAVNPAHKPPFTGAHNQADIDRIVASWASVQDGYASCLAQNGGGSGGGGSMPVVEANILKTLPLKVPNNLGTNYVRMEWDLQTQSNRMIPMILGIEIRKAVIGGITRGYELRGPTLRLKSASAGKFKVRALNVYINDALQPGITIFSPIDAEISSTTNVVLLDITSIGIAGYDPIANTDTISLEFSSVVGDVPETPVTPVPPAPTPPAPGATAVTYTQLMQANGVFTRNCCLERSN